MNRKAAWISVVVGVTALMYSARAETQGCRADEYKSYEDDRVIHCTKRPNWTSLVRSYHDSREIMSGIAPNENRCAMALSAALNLRPANGELSLADLRASVHDSMRAAVVLDRYYVRAADLKNRLERERPFGRAAEVFADPDLALARIRGRRGIIFFDAADPNPATRGSQLDPRRTNHIDVWDRNGTLSGYVYRAARAVWFWEVPE